VDFILTKKVGLTLAYLDTHIKSDPDLCPIESYLGRMKALDYKTAAAKWMETFPEGIPKKLDLRTPKDPLTVETLARRFGLPSLTYTDHGSRVSWIYADEKNEKIIAIDWGILKPHISLCVKASNFDEALGLIQKLLEVFPRQAPPNLPTTQ
jgi:hypothetical protein